MKKLVITKAEENQRLDKFLIKYLNKAGSSFVYKMLRKKNIKLNDKKAKGNEILKAFDEVTLYLADETIDKFHKAEKRAQGLSLDKKDIVYEDKDLLIINKKSGILSQKASDKDISVNDMALNYVLDKMTEEEKRAFTPSICNRLDRNTSGLIIFGKNLKTLQYFSEIMKSREIKKYYLCLVKGLTDEEGRLDDRLVKDEKENLVKIKKEGEGEEVSLRYKRLAVINGDSLLSVDLITGKSHQIRAQLSKAGHPVIGDPKYGDRRLNEDYRSDYGVRSQLLHSYILILPDKRVFKAPLPREFTRAIGDSIKCPHGIPEDLEVVF